MTAQCGQSYVHCSTSWCLHGEQRRSYDGRRDRDGGESALLTDVGHNVSLIAPVITEQRRQTLQKPPGRSLLSYFD